MCAIQQDRRILIDHFQSPGPIDRTQTSPYRFSRDRNPLRGCRLQERQCTGRVIQLMSPLQDTSQSVIVETHAAIGKVLGPRPFCAKVFMQTKHRGLPFLGHLLDRVPSLIIELPQHHRHPRFDNASLLERDR